MTLPSWLVETWVEYVVGLVIALVRIGLRTRLLGVKGWQGDDYLVIVAIAWFTLTVVCFHVINVLIYGIPDNTGTNIGLTDDDVAQMTPQRLSQTRTGSIVNVLSWWSWAGLLWTCKGCMLFFYSRITFRTWQMKMVKATAWLVGLTYIASFLVNIFKCIPVHKNWDVIPLPGKCPAGALNLYFTGICNFITDVIILIIPFPLLLRVHLPWRKKVLVILMLSSGAFTIIVSLLRLVFSIAAVFDMGPKDLGFRDRDSDAAMASFCLNIRIYLAPFTAIVIINIPVIFSCVNRLRNPTSHRGSIGSYTHSQPLTEISAKGATLRKSSYGPNVHVGIIPSPERARLGSATTAMDRELSDKASETTLPGSPDLKITRHQTT